MSDIKLSSLTLNGG